MICVEVYSHLQDGSGSRSPTATVTARDATTMGHRPSTKLVLPGEPSVLGGLLVGEEEQLPGSGEQ